MLRQPGKTKSRTVAQCLMPAAVRSEDVLFAVTQPEHTDGGHHMGLRGWELGGREGHTRLGEGACWLRRFLPLPRWWEGSDTLFINERFATVRPRLVAGRFIRKGSSLSLVKGVCVVSGRCVSVQTVYVVQCPHPAIVAHVERFCRSLRKGCPRIVAPSPHVAPPDGVRPSPQLSTPPTCSIVGEEKFTLRLISTMSTGPCTRVESASILVSGAK